MFDDGGDDKKHADRFLGCETSSKTAVHLLVHAALHGSYVGRE